MTKNGINLLWYYLQARNDQGTILDHKSAGKKRLRWAGFPVATTTPVLKPSACAARTTSASIAAVGAVGWPPRRACAHKFAASRIAAVVKGQYSSLRPS